MQTVTATVHKPLDSDPILFTLAGEAEESFTAAFQCDADFVEFVSLADSPGQPLKSNRVEYKMSSARPERQQEFSMRVLGRKVSWSDDIHNVVANISVLADNATKQTAQLKVVVKPYGSCKHSQIKKVPDRTVEHSWPEIEMLMRAHDIDDLPIVATDITFKMSWAYLGTSKTGPAKATQSIVAQRSPSAPNEYTATVVAAMMKRAGWYQVDLQLKDGWNGTHVAAWCSPQNGSIPGPWMVEVFCAPGFAPDILNDNMCTNERISTICPEVDLTIDATPIQVSNQSGVGLALIGTNDQLSVTFHDEHSLTNVSEYTVRSVPLRDSKTKPLGSTRQVKFDMKNTGAYKLELIHKKGQVGEQSCTLISNLTMSCKEGFEPRGTECQEKV